MSRYPTGLPFGNGLRNVTAGFGAGLGCTSRYAICVLAAVLVGITTAMPPTYGQVVLDGPNVSGTIGLNGETFGSANVGFYWSGASVQTQLANGDSDFSVRVEPDKLLNANVAMYSFQGGTNA